MDTISQTPLTCPLPREGFLAINGDRCRSNRFGSLSSFQVDNANRSLHLQIPKSSCVFLDSIPTFDVSMARDLGDGTSSIDDHCSQDARGCNAGKLLPEQLVAAYASIKMERLQLIGSRQRDFRSALYQGLVCSGADSDGAEEVVLHTYPAAASLLRHMSSPSLSITVACGPEWAALVHKSPALVARRFSLALNSTLGTIIERSPFGTVVTGNKKRWVPQQSRWVPQQSESKKDHDGCKKENINQKASSHKEKTSYKIHHGKILLRH